MKIPLLFKWGLVLLVLQACSQPLPVERYSFFEFTPYWVQSGDTVVLHVKNPVACPLRVTVMPDSSLVANAGEARQIVLAPYDSTVLRFRFLMNPDPTDTPFHYQALLGDPGQLHLDTSYRYAFPFPRGRKIRVVQGYFGSFSHRGLMRNYALDLRMNIGDTVCAARAGVVVARIEGYNVHGSTEAYKSFANCICVYHSDGSIGQYVHLKQYGALVDLGDTVQRGQPIGLAGMTGLTTVPHLHFNVVVPTTGGAESVPVRFEKIDGKNISKGMVLWH